MDCPPDPALHLDCTTRYTLLSQKLTKVFDLWEQLLAYTNSVPPYQRNTETYNITNGITNSVVNFQNIIKQINILEQTPNSTTDSRWNLIEASIVRQTQIFDNTLDTIRAALNNRINPRFITPHLLKDLISLMNQRHQHAQAPKVNMYSTDFKQVGEIKLFKEKNTLIIGVKFFLFSPMFELYKIYSVLVPQANGVSATITPAHHYIAQSPKDTHHFQFDNKESCLQSNRQFYCRITPTIRITPSCESSILNNTTHMDWSLCDIRIHQHQRNQWIQLEENDGLLFSTPWPEDLEVKCNRASTQTITLHGLGVLRMDANCQGITSDRLLPAILSRRTNATTFKTTLQLKISTQPDIMEITVKNIRITLYVVIVMFILLIVSFVTYTITRNFIFNSIFSPHSNNTYTALDPLNKDTPITNNIATQTESTQQKVTFDLTLNQQPILDSDDRPPLTSFAKPVTLCGASTSTSTAIIKSINNTNHAVGEGTNETKV